jgi:hypothetical protein
LDFEERIKKVDELIGEWFSQSKEKIAKPSDLERFLVEKNIYPEYREGWFLREDLRSLEAQKRLDIFEHTILERQPRSWTFYAKEKENKVEEKSSDQGKKLPYLIAMGVILSIIAFLILYKR